MTGYTVLILEFYQRRCRHAVTISCPTLGSLGPRAKYDARTLVTILSQGDFAPRWGIQFYLKIRPTVDACQQSPQWSMRCSIST